ncbi:MAG: hypothetical protein ACFB0G_24555 [Leptolyngbyaceae cyanobacterium]
MPLLSKAHWLVFSLAIAARLLSLSRSQTAASNVTFKRFVD